MKKKKTRTRPGLEPVFSAHNDVVNQFNDGARVQVRFAIQIVGAPGTHLVLPVDSKDAAFAMT